MLQTVELFTEYTLKQISENSVILSWQAEKKINIGSITVMRISI